MAPREKSATVDFKVRVKEPLRAALEASASERGISMNAEVVTRLEQSFQTSGTLEESLSLAFGKRVAGLLIIIGDVMTTVGRAVGKRAADFDAWMDDPAGYIGAKFAAEDILEKAGPAETPRDLDKQIELVKDSYFHRRMGFEDKKPPVKATVHSIDVVSMIGADRFDRIIEPDKHAGEAPAELPPYAPVSPLAERDEPIQVNFAARFVRMIETSALSKGLHPEEELQDRIAASFTQTNMLYSLMDLEFGDHLSTLLTMLGEAIRDALGICQRNFKDRGDPLKFLENYFFFKAAQKVAAIVFEMNEPAVDESWGDRPATPPACGHLVCDSEALSQLIATTISGVAGDWIERGTDEVLVARLRERLDAFNRAENSRRAAFQNHHASASDSSAGQNG